MVKNIVIKIKEIQHLVRIWIVNHFGFVSHIRQKSAWKIFFRNCTKKDNKDEGFLLTYLDSADQTSINQVNWCPQLEILLVVDEKL